MLPANPYGCIASSPLAPPRKLVNSLQISLKNCSFLNPSQLPTHTYPTGGGGDNFMKKYHRCKSHNGKGISGESLIRGSGGSVFFLSPAVKGFGEVACSSSQRVVDGHGSFLSAWKLCGLHYLATAGAPPIASVHSACLLQARRNAPLPWLFKSAWTHSALWNAAFHVAFPARHRPPRHLRSVPQMLFWPQFCERPASPRPGPKCRVGSCSTSIHGHHE